MEDEYVERTRSILTQLRQGDARALYQAMAPELAGQFSLYQLSEMAQQLSWLTGAFQGWAKETVQTLAGGETAVRLEEQFERLTVQAQFIYDQAGRLKQFGLRPLEKARPLYTPISCADFVEEPLTLGEPPIDGLLTLPQTGGRPPVIVLVQGSGQSDYNESVGALPNRPFAELAHGLARRGIATVRFHKRFYQYPPQSAEALAQITIEQEVLADVDAAINWLSQDQRLNQQAVFALGHSLGGYLMPRIAARQQKLCGVICLNGPWRPIPEILAAQKLALLADNPYLDDEQKLSARAEIQAELAKLADPLETRPVFGQPMGYWRSLEQDQQTLLAQSQAAVLVLEGAHDFQVDGPAECALWLKALANRPQSGCKLYPGLNHLMAQAPAQPLDMTLYDRPCPLAEEVVDDIAQWVKKLTANNQ